MGSTLRVGVVGAGAIATLAHIPNLQAIDGVAVTALSDINIEHARNVAQRFNIGQCFAETEALVASPDVDAVVVCTPNHAHREAVEAAARHGKPVFVEKPLASNLRDGRAMVEACRAAGVPIQVGFNQRFWNQTEIAKQLIEDGVIGEVQSFRSIYSEGWDLYPAENTASRYDPKISGGGTIMDLAIHRIDMARHLVGEITAVVADLRRNVIPFPVDDTVHLLVEFANGATGTISSDRFSPAVANATEIFGTEGTIYLSTETINPFQSVPLAVFTKNELPPILEQYFYPAQWWDKPGKTWICVTPPRDSSHFKEMAAWVDSVKNGTPPPVTGDDGLKALEVIAAAYKSQRERTWVNLPLAEDNVEMPRFDEGV